MIFLKSKWQNLADYTTDFRHLLAICV